MFLMCISRPKVFFRIYLKGHTFCDRVSPAMPFKASKRISPKGKNLTLEDFILSLKVDHFREGTQN